MTLNFSNTNAVWASILAETLYRLGLRTAILCPGSRSTPLTLAFAQHPHIEAIPILDERSACFFALGRARQSQTPVVVVCTSGTAGANFYPAVIEAREGRIPLLVLTSDRPPELRDCNAGQTVDQQKLFGSYPNWYSELAVPSLDLSLLAYLRQTLIYAWERSLAPVAGAVHLNLPFRDPLSPIPQPEAALLANRFPADFFEFEMSQMTSEFEISQMTQPWSLPQEWFQSSRGILIAGVAQPRFPQRYCLAIAHLSRSLGIPVLAEGLSPVRNHAAINPYLVSTYGQILREVDLAELTPDWVIRVGEMPTNKELRQWLTQIQPRQWVINSGDRNLDPLHGKTTHLRLWVEQLAMLLPDAAPPSAYLKQWQEAEATMRQAIDRAFSQITDGFEGKAAWLLSQHLPAQTPLFIANSMSVREVESYWKPNHLQIQPFCNRGANGIDGTLSTALGMAHRQQSSILLTGDLALLHDTNGFLMRHKFVGHLTIVLINNNGGGIFESLPIAQFDPPFEDFFATPQTIDFAKLCATYDVEHELMQSWEQFVQRLNPLPAGGIRVLEIRTDRKADAQRRRSQRYL